MKIINEKGEEYPVLNAPTGDSYICASPGEAFEIKLEKLEYDGKVFAPKLFIDGAVNLNEVTLNRLFMALEHSRE